MVRFLRPGSLAEACAMRAEQPDAVPLAGGTDLLVQLNLRRERPAALLDLSGVAELAEWSREGDGFRIGAGVSFTRIVGEIGEQVPALAAAARTIGSAQIRNRGTLGGNLGTASPAGDALPPLVATGGEVELVSVRGRRTVSVEEFCTGPKTSLLAPDELVAEVRVPVRRGPQHFAKVGPRNAMVIAVAAVATAVDAPGRAVRVAFGAAGPRPARARPAEEFAAAALDWDRGPVEPGVAARFGALVAESCAPIDDVRATAAYRRRAVAVLAARSLTWTWNEYRRDMCA
ncbi:FAD binding domain-containing protein [Pseudonocardia sichuanensis]